VNIIYNINVLKLESDARSCAVMYNLYCCHPIAAESRIKHELLSTNMTVSDGLYCCTAAVYLLQQLIVTALSPTTT
jgi:hypothetical protein